MPLKRKRSRSPETTPSRRCSFGQVQVREYDIVLAGGGGVPSEGGPPLGLGWQVVNQSQTSLANFEQARIGVRSPREVYMSEGFLSARQRSRILKQVGHSKKEIKKAAKRVEEVQLARWELNTVQADNWLFDTQSVDSAMEVASDLGFERSEARVLDGMQWHQKASLLREIAKHSNETQESSLVWKEVRVAAQGWFQKDCAFIIRCPPQTPSRKHSVKARSRISRFVDCLASTWQEIQDKGKGEQVGSLAVILCGWDDHQMAVEWKNRSGGHYEVEELCI